MSGLKIVIIGAGSSYTPELIEGLINRSAELHLAGQIMSARSSGPAAWMLASVTSAFH